MKTTPKIIEHYSGYQKYADEARDLSGLILNMEELAISSGEPPKRELLTLGILCGGRKKILRDDGHKVIMDDFKMLKECLENNASIADSIVVVTNNTNLTVLNYMTSRILDKYDVDLRCVDTDRFDVLRNEILNRVDTEWVLMLDIDEDIAGKYDELRGILENADNDIAGFVVSIYSPVWHDDKGKTEQTYSEYLRIIRNHPDYYYTGIVHEDALPSLLADTKNIVTTLNPEIYINHAGYFMELERKFKESRNFAMVEKQIETDPTPAALLFRGLHYKSIGNFDGAERDLTAAVRLIVSDDRFRSQSGLGMQINISLLQISWEKAKLFQDEMNKSIAIERAIGLEKEIDLFKLPKYIIGCYLLAKGNNPGAKEMFTKLLYLMDNNPNDEFKEASRSQILSVIQMTEKSQT